MRSIKATIIKEFRENLRWAVLILIISSALLAAGLNDQFNMGMSILGDGFLKICLAMYPLLGLALGMLQIFQDSRKGRWQFVSHRPMSRTRLLGCKIATGITLYLTAALIPWLITVRWVSTPGHVPGPFAWDMTEPSLAYLLWGLIWYAAGLLVAARKARWFGSRLIPLGGAIAGSWACYAFSWTLTESIVITLAATALLLIAAFSVFHTGGESDRSPTWSKPLIATPLLFGWIVLLTVSMLMGDAAIREFYPKASDYTQAGQYRWMPDGTLQIWTYGTNSNGVVRAQNLKGDDVPLPPKEYWSIPTPPMASIYFPDASSPYRSSYPAFHEGFLQPQTHAIPVGNQWFFISSRRLFEHYDQENHQLLLRAGAQGIGMPNARVYPFSADARYSNAVGLESLIITPEAVYLVDLSKPSITKLFTTLTDDPVITASTSEVENYAHKEQVTDQPLLYRPPFTVVATQSAFHIVQDGQPNITLPRDSALEKLGPLQFVRTATGGFTIASIVNGFFGWGLDLLTYDQSGHLVDQIHQPPAPKSKKNDEFDLEEFGALTLAPQGFFTFVMIERGELASAPWHVYALLIGSCISYTTLAFLLLQLRHSTRAQKYIWLPIAAALGFTGILLLISMLDFPKSIRCPHCRKRRLLTEDRCPHCNTTAQSPPMEGIEIFENTGINLSPLTATLT